jgi:hypothetical protein
MLLADDTLAEAVDVDLVQGVDHLPNHQLLGQELESRGGAEGESQEAGQR